MMFEFVLPPLYQHSLMEIWALISNHVNCSVSGFITNPCPNFNDSLTKPPLKFGHVWAITSELVYMCMITYPGHNHDVCLPNLWKEKVTLLPKVIGKHCDDSSMADYTIYFVLFWHLAITVHAQWYFKTKPLLYSQYIPRNMYIFCA